MKLPSLQTLYQAAAHVLSRFPLEIFCATLGTSLALWQLERDEPDLDIFRLILCSVLGLVLFLSTSIFSESRSLGKKQRSLLQTSAALVLVVCWFAIHPIDAETSVIRYAMFAVAFHLLVSIAPQTSVAGFWEYNKQLFLRILIAQLYSWVLFAGLCIALASTDFLFNLDIDYKNYARLWILILGLFNTIFFLAGVPDHFKNLHEQYPKGLKVFTQYVLIPLAIIYVCIILAYEAKVMVEWSLPKGIISWLILGYAVYGILSILLVHPVRLIEENKWISTYSRWFYFLIIPLLPLLSLAIGMRIQDYGITELRYIVVVLTVWLTGITLYFLISKKQNIKVIPTSLALLALLSAWGPQSASSVSARSQVKRLVTLFENEGSFKEGQLVPMSASISDSIGNEAINQLRFVNERYSTEILLPLLPMALRDSLVRTDTIKNKYTKNYVAFTIIREGLALKSYYSTTKQRDNYFNATSENRHYSVAGFDSLRSEEFYNLENATTQEFTIARESLHWLEKEDTVTFKLTSVLNAVEERSKITKENYINNMDSKLMNVESTSRSSRRAKLILNRISFTRDSTERKISELEFHLLYNQK